MAYPCKHGTQSRLQHRLQPTFRELLSLSASHEDCTSAVAACDQRELILPRLAASIGLMECMKCTAEAEMCSAGEPLLTSCACRDLHTLTDVKCSNESSRPVAVQVWKPESNSAAHFQALTFSTCCSWYGSVSSIINARPPIPTSCSFSVSSATSLPSTSTKEGYLLMSAQAISKFRVHLRSLKFFELIRGAIELPNPSRDLYLA